MGPTLNAVHIGDARELAMQLTPQSVNCIVTSPPYFGLRSYLAPDHPDKAREMGSEVTPDEFVAQLVALFAALRPALRDDGSLWLNLGDSYAVNGGARGYGSTDGAVGRADAPGELRRAPGGYKAKDLVGIPWLMAFALRADGWYLRSDIVWHKPNPMPESVRDRPTRSHEYLFLLSKGPRYYYDADAIREPLLPASIKRGEYGHSSFGKGQFVGSPTDQRHQDGKGVGKVSDLQNPAGANKRDVWTIPTTPYPDAHFATFPPELIRPCIRAGCPVGGVVLDPFAGSGTVAEVCVEEGRNWLGFELDERSVGWHEGRLRALPVRSLFAAT